MRVSEHAQRCADLSEAIAPLIEHIDQEIARDYSATFAAVVRHDAERADARELIRCEWNLHTARTRILRKEREQIIFNAANIISALSPMPVVVTYLGETVYP